MRIEVVQVCVGYADFLAATLPENLPLVDDLVVVTSPDDEETRAVCRKHSVHHVLSDDHQRDGPFNKARMIQRAFDQLRGKDWILHLDADIVLPRKFRQFIDWAHPDERTIYGADRCNLSGFDEWAQLKQYAGAGIIMPTSAGTGFTPSCRWVCAGSRNYMDSCRLDSFNCFTARP